MYSINDIGKLKKQINWLRDQIKCLSLSNTTNLEIIKVILGNLDTSGTTIESALVAKLNSVSFNYAGHEIPFFQFTVGSSIYVYTLNKEVRGSYGLGNYNLKSSDVQYISSTVLNLGTISSEAETIDAGNIGTSDIWTFVNTQTYQIQPLAEGFTIFKGTQNGEELYWIYQGQSGTVGIGGYPTVEADFRPLSPNISSTPVLQEVIDAGNGSVEGLFYNGTQLFNSTSTFLLYNSIPNISEINRIEFQNEELNIAGSKLRIQNSETTDEGKILRVNTQGYFEIDEEQVIPDPTWGNIQGTLSDQSDLQQELNTRDTNNRNRDNHTGTQAISTVENLQSTLDNKASIPESNIFEGDTNSFKKVNLRSTNGDFDLKNIDTEIPVLPVGIDVNLGNTLGFNSNKDLFINLYRTELSGGAIPTEEEVLNTSIFKWENTQPRTHIFPDKSGTVAHTDDIPDVSAIQTNTDSIQNLEKNKSELFSELYYYIGTNNDLSMTGVGSNNQPYFLFKKPNGDFAFVVNRQSGLRLDRFRLIIPFFNIDIVLSEISYQNASNYGYYFADTSGKEGDPFVGYPFDIKRLNVINETRNFANSGASITFNYPGVYGTPNNPLSGAINEFSSNPKRGQIQKIYWDDSVDAPLPTAWKKTGINGEAELLLNAANEGLVNIIFAEWVSENRREYWVTQTKL